MQYKIAEFSDIKATLKLHTKYQVDSIKEEDKKVMERSNETNF